MVKQHFFTDEDNYIEAQRRVKLCAEKGKKTLDLSDLNLKSIPHSFGNLSSLKNFIFLPVKT